MAFYLPVCLPLCLCVSSTQVRFNEMKYNSIDLKQHRGQGNKGRSKCSAIPLLHSFFEPVPTHFTLTKNSTRLYIKRLRCWPLFLFYLNLPLLNFARLLFTPGFFFVVSSFFTLIASQSFFLCSRHTIVFLLSVLVVTAYFVSSPSPSTNLLSARLESNTNEGGKKKSSTKHPTIRHTLVLF